jgi:hypothetical protein
VRQEVVSLEKQIEDERKLHRKDLQAIPAYKKAIQKISDTSMKLKNRLEEMEIEKGRVIEEIEARFK